MNPTIGNPHPSRAGLRVVVVGTGRFGALHARVWTEAGADVVGLADLDAERAADVAARVGGAEIDVDAARLLERVRPDAVVVASDEASHARLALAALDAGCHVLVEKPLALSGNAAADIATAAARAGRQVVAGNISRFGAPYRHIRRALAAGRIGPLWALRLRRDFSRSWFASFGDRVHPIWESLVHDVDLAVAFVGEPVERVVAQDCTAAGSAAPSVVTALLRFGSGVTATVESAWVLPDRGPQTVSGALELTGTIAGEVEALGPGGTIRQRLVSDALVEWADSGVHVPDLLLWPEEDGEVGGALRSEVDYAIGVFTGTRAHDVVPLEQAVWGVHALEAVERSLRTGQPVDLPPAAP